MSVITDEEVDPMYRVHKGLEHRMEIRPVCSWMCVEIEWGSFDDSKDCCI